MFKNLLKPRGMNSKAMANMMYSATDLLVKTGFDTKLGLSSSAEWEESSSETSPDRKKEYQARLNSVQTLKDAPRGINHAITSIYPRSHYHCHTNANPNVNG